VTLSQYPSANRGEHRAGRHSRPPFRWKRVIRLAGISLRNLASLASPKSINRAPRKTSVARMEPSVSGASRSGMQARFRLAHPRYFACCRRTHDGLRRAEGFDPGFRFAPSGLTCQRVKRHNLARTADSPTRRGRDARYRVTVTAPDRAHRPDPPPLVRPTARRKVNESLTDVSGLRCVDDTVDPRRPARSRCDGVARCRRRTWAGRAGNRIRQGLPESACMRRSTVLVFDGLIRGTEQRAAASALMRATLHTRSPRGLS